MASCLPAREVIICLRWPHQEKGTHYTVICPARWEKSDLLRYCREEHPGETVRIVEWKPVCEDGDGWGARLWLANPRDFSDYVRAVKEPSSVTV